jgi:hypothetical protein
LVTDSHSILVVWWNHFSQLFSVRGVSDLRRTEIHTAQPIVPGPSPYGIEMVIAKLTVTSPNIDQIPGALIKAGV